MCRSPKKSAQKNHTRHRKLLDRTRYTKKTATRKNARAQARKPGPRSSGPSPEARAQAQAQARPKLGPKPGSKAGPKPRPKPGRQMSPSPGQSPGPSPGLSPGPTLGESREGRHGRLIKPVADSGSYRGDLGTPKHETTYSNLNAGNSFLLGPGWPSECPWVPNRISKML